MQVFYVYEECVDARNARMGDSDVAVEIREAKLLSQEDIVKYAGRWVAIKDGQVVFDDDTPETVTEWLGRSGTTADIVRQLPSEPEAEVWILLVR